MKNQVIAPRQEEQPPPDLWSHHVMGDHNFWSDRGVLAWWYRHTAPPEPPAGASFEQRDLVRRGRIASAIMLFLACILVLVVPIGLLGPNTQILYTALTVWGVIGLCIVLNRKGHVNAVGILLCLSIISGMYLSILRAPGGLSPDDKDILYLLVFGELFIGAILPVRWVFVPTLLNLTFGVLELTVAPHTPLFAVQLVSSGPIILFRLIQLHVFVAAVMAILGLHARQAIKRADRAEEIARLQQMLAQMNHAQMQHAQHLETTVTAIIGVLTRTAHGDLLARVPIQHGETFWSLVGSLNLLLARYQDARQDAQELERLRPQMEHWQHCDQALRWMRELEEPFARMVSVALQEQRPLNLPATHTPLAPFFRQLHGKYLSDRPATSLPSSTRMTG
ncbi:MAG TPA: hypothetical protein VFB60_24650 [Ktedonobacteraceae bacterium]|nr:hypothetical protein [Ktedonobacteraceae bacterium]